MTKQKETSIVCIKYQDREHFFELKRNKGSRYIKKTIVLGEGSQYTYIHEYPDKEPSIKKYDSVHKFQFFKQRFEKLDAIMREIEQELE